MIMQTVFATTLNDNILAEPLYENTKLGFKGNYIIIVASVKLKMFLADFCSS